MTDYDEGYAVGYYVGYESGHEAGRRKAQLLNEMPRLTFNVGDRVVSRTTPNFLYGTVVPNEHESDYVAVLWDVDAPEDWEYWDADNLRKVEDAPTFDVGDRVRYDCRHAGCEWCPLFGTVVPNPDGNDYVTVLWDEFATAPGDPINPDSVEYWDAEDLEKVDDND